MSDVLDRTREKGKKVNKYGKWTLHGSVAKSGHRLHMLRAESSAKKQRLAWCTVVLSFVFHDHSCWDLAWHVLWLLRVSWNEEEVIRQGCQSEVAFPSHRGWVFSSVSVSVPVTWNSKNACAPLVDIRLFVRVLRTLELWVKMTDMIYIPPLTVAETLIQISRHKEPQSPLSIEDTTFFLGFWSIVEIKHLGHTWFTLRTQSLLVVFILPSVSAYPAFRQMWFKSLSFMCSFTHSANVYWRPAMCQGLLQGTRVIRGNTRGQVPAFMDRWTLLS